MNRISAILSIGITMAIISCGSGQSGKEEAKDTAAAAPLNDTAVAATKVTEPAFTPFKVMIITHKVKNFAKWKPLYDGHDSARHAYGLSNLGLGRGLTDSNLVVVINKMDDAAKAKQFAMLPDLKTTMQKGGVVGTPKISYIEVIRDDNSNVEQKERVIVAHKVKDFDTWLKAFDASKTDRPANGLLDRGIGRGVDDPNMVYVLFAVTDFAKAKARMNSPELKKIMTDAGVVGPPQTTFFRATE